MVFFVLEASSDGIVAARPAYIFALAFVLTDRITSLCRLFLRNRYDGFREKYGGLRTPPTTQIQAGRKFSLCRNLGLKSLAQRTLAGLPSPKSNG